MKTSIQKQFDILMIAAQVGCTKLEAIAASKGWTIKTLSAEKAEIVKDAVVKITAKRSTKLRKSAAKTAARRGGHKAPFQRFAGRLVVAVNTTTVDLTEQIRSVKAQSRAKTVAVQGYIKALGVAKKATAKAEEARRSTIGWSASLLKAMGKAAQAVAALEAAKVAL